MFVKFVDMSMTLPLAIQIVELAQGLRLRVCQMTGSALFVVLARVISKRSNPEKMG